MPSVPQTPMNDNPHPGGHPPPTASGPPQPRLLSLGGLLGEFEADANARHDARVKGIPRGPISGLRSLDDVLGGAWEPGLHPVHGGPGVGKTAFALQGAADCGFPALYVTCEMRPVELLRRVTARATETYLGRLKSGELAPADAIAKAQEACRLVPRLAIADACDAYASPDWLYTAAKRVQRDAAHVLVVVDSVHSWSEAAPDQGRLSEYDRLDAALRALRLLANRLNCPILAIAERNRMSMKDGGLHASAGNRGFEYSGETVIGLDKDDRKDAAVQVSTHETPIVLEVAKNRHGATKRLRLTFHGALQRFTDRERTP